MKTTALLGSIFACSIFTGLLHAQQKPTTQIRVQAEFIDVSHEQLTELMFGEKVSANDGELRKQVAQLVKDGKASIVETMLCVANSGMKATTESIEELIYPTEYEPASGGANLDSFFKKKDEEKPPEWKDIIASAVGPTPTAFETRNTGSTMEIEATLGVNDKTVRLRIVPELVHHVGNQIWAEWKDEHGSAPIQMPTFYTLRINSNVTLTLGNYMLLAALSPKDKNGHPDFTRKLMVFVKADEVGN
jgi:hypothetical protein